MSFAPSSPNANAAILVFAKAPRIGRVKTRLARTLGDDAALGLYRAFVADLLETLSGAGWPVVVCHHPAGAEEVMRSWLGGGWTFRPQEGEDLGERMANALAAAFGNGIRQALVVGGDLPDLPQTIFTSAFRGISRNGAALGPASDGGYYLIGFSAAAFRPGVFRGIPWGTGAVYRQTLARMAEYGLFPAILPVWNDVDTEKDLWSLRGAEAAPRTRACLRALGLAPPAGSLGE
jgi:rSAM/selenodomain-associated transferase 1